MQVDVHLATVIVVICLVGPFSVDNCFKVLFLEMSGDEVY